MKRKLHQSNEHLRLYLFQQEVQNLWPQGTETENISTSNVS